MGVGVLRALGITRSALFRMILVEGLLIGLVACLLSLSFGVMAGWCGKGISQYVSFFGGLATPLVVPWPKLTLGFSAALALSLAAALWPAISAGRAEPLAPWQEGRSELDRGYSRPAARCAARIGSPKRERGQVVSWP